jgi:hypothetical protein
MTTVDEIPPTPGLNAVEKGFVHRFAEHYKRVDNLSWAYSYTMGWLVISEPVEQRASQLVDTLGVTRDDVDHVSRLLATPGVVERRELPGQDDYVLSLPDGNWPKIVSYSLTKIPSFHAILQRGLELLDGATDERRRRIVELERIYRHLADEIPQIFERYEQSTRN